MRRRHMIGGLAAASLAPVGLRMARADVGDDALILLVAGPDGAQTCRWGNACALALQAALPGAPDLLVEPIGGLDGVTGANRLDALVVPDGKTAAILPGSALIAWLTGDSRVHFDPTRWSPLMAGGSPGVLVARLPAGASASLSSLRSISPLRLAVDQPQSNDLAALLALARLQVPTAPVFGLRDIGQKSRAFAASEVDAVLVSGENVPADIAPLIASGGVPVFSLGCQLADGSIGNDPAFPGLPDVTRFGGTSSAFLDMAYRAAAAAARLDFMMVFPKLTDPSAIAQWQAATNSAIEMPGLMAAASASSVSLQPAPVLAAALAALNLVQVDQTDLQAFLVKSFGWQPG